MYSCLVLTLQKNVLPLRRLVFSSRSDGDRHSTTWIEIAKESLCGLLIEIISRCILNMHRLTILATMPSLTLFRLLDIYKGLCKMHPLICSSRSTSNILSRCLMISEPCLHSVCPR